VSNAKTKTCAIHKTEEASGEAEARPFLKTEETSG